MQAQKFLKRKNKALSEGNKTLLASTCIDLADLYVTEGLYNEAVDEYLIVAKVYKEMGKLLDFARANRMIGEAYTHLSEYDKAISYQQIYLNIAIEQKDKVEEQRALATIGHTYLTIHLTAVSDLDKTSLKLARKSFMKSLDVCESLANVINKHEHKDMTARLLANLGIVEECQNHFEKAIELLEKSITMCKAYDLYEQLERSHTLLGALYARTAEYNKAVHQYNLAIEVAGRLKNRISLICSLLSSKADILIKLCDLRGAKTVLLKAYKLNSPVISEREIIEHNLKVVAAMCYAEDSLLTVCDSDYVRKKELYEKLGDGACSIKNYTKGIEYYHKMLEAAKNNNESGAQLSPCYISLAETYRDNKQYNLAIQYFKEEYNCLKEHANENISTLLNITDCMEAAKKSVEEIEIYFKEARKECIKLNDKKLEYKVLSRYIGVLRKYEKTSQADELEVELIKIGFVNVESDSEASQDENTPNVGDEIAISDITDISDDSETENVDLKSKRKRTKGLVMKRNNKGETQLHTACINGNADLVKHLLDQGHPVNVRDHCGWLPIHEACICGHIDIVNMLVNKGANINDRGGTLCNGTTPLHDAATNGHLEVIQLLLNKNACTTSKNDLGEIPLQILKKWRQGNELDNDSEECLYNSLIKRLEQDADKLGHSKSIVHESNNYAFEINSQQSLSSQRKSSTRTANLKSSVGSLRRNVSFDSDIDNPDEANYSTSNKQSYITNTYKEVMESLKHPHWDTIEKKRKSEDGNTKSAHVELDIADDWLENDIESGRQKKRKVVSDDLITTSNTRRTSAGCLSLSRHSSASLKSKTSLSEDAEFANEFLDSEFNLNELDNISLQDDIEQFVIDCELNSLSSSNKPESSRLAIQQGSNSRNLSVSKPKQSKLSHFGHIRSVTPVERKNSLTSIRNDNQSSGIVNNLFHNEPMLSIDVDVDGKLYRVPVLASEIHSRTIKWLADEAAKRYGRKESLKPTVELETRNGVSLADDDVVSILFAAGSTKAEEVLARILNWNLPPLLDRYREACSITQIECNENIEKILQESSTVLDLSNLGLKSDTLAPLCKAINRQNNLHSLNLCANIIDQNTMQLLCSSLSSLDNLKTLDLSLTQLRFSSWECLADLFTHQTSKAILPNLIHLDLSFNPLGDESFKCLAIVTRYLKLETLNLISVDFTSDIFNVISNKNVELCMDHVQNFNISYNSLGKQEIVTFITWLNPQQIEVLDISNNLIVEEGLTKEVVNWLQAFESYNLKSLNVSRCNVQDVEVYQLLNTFQNTGKLNSINLSYNPNLTSLSLRRFIQQSSIVELDLSGCKNVFKYFGDCTENTWIVNKLQQLKLTFDAEKNSSEAHILINSWKNHYKERAGVKQDLLGYLEFYITK